MGRLRLNGIEYTSQVPYRELTKAEYDALPDSKYNDGVIYYIRDMNSPGSTDYHEYSTEEKVVGKWIDGKPIYERVITKTASGPWPSVFTTLEYFPNLETCIKIEMIIHRSGGSFYTANGGINVEYTDVPSYPTYRIGATMWDVNTTPNLQYYVNGYNYTDVDKLYFIVQYTKT